MDNIREQHASWDSEAGAEKTTFNLFSQKLPSRLRSKKAATTREEIAAAISDIEWSELRKMLQEESVVTNSAAIQFLLKSHTDAQSERRTVARVKEKSKHLLENQTFSENFQRRFMLSKLFGRTPGKTGESDGVAGNNISQSTCGQTEMWKKRGLKKCRSESDKSTLSWVEILGNVPKSDKDKGIVKSETNDSSSQKGSSSEFNDPSNSPSTREKVRRVSFSKINTSRQRHQRRVSESDKKLYVPLIAFDESHKVPTPWERIRKRISDPESNFDEDALQAVRSIDLGESTDLESIIEEAALHMDDNELEDCNIDKSALKPARLIDIGESTDLESIIEDAALHMDDNELEGCDIDESVLKPVRLIDMGESTDFESIIEDAPHMEENGLEGRDARTIDAALQHSIELGETDLVGQHEKKFQDAEEGYAALQDIHFIDSEESECMNLAQNEHESEDCDGGETYKVLRKSINLAIRKDA